MKSKKRLAADILGTSPKKVKFAADALEDIKKAITRSDLRGLIAIKKIVKSKKNEQSRSRARKIAAQKRKGRQKGKGSKKGSKHSIVSRKEKWMAKVRVQRVFLKDLKDKELVSVKNYRSLYNKVKGGFFRNKRHIKLYLTEYHLIEKKEK
ncbi:50S ribosomal protein L19e [Candidatus Woesearchaeota archaeon]|jgi:large subunit ribosomal protein L19e|nr:50S ribosomal protein L19e [Candidatus Woesearchaeota archaeon]MBT5342354.1 50S ribosomal protein L19e [Candidatus Woesearchaeota archaeon]